MLRHVHDSTSNYSVSMMVLQKPAIFMMASIMTESMRVSKIIIQNRITLNKIQQLIEEVPSLLKGARGGLSCITCCFFLFFFVTHNN